MSTSAIEWTEVTWNPTVGCDRISPGCAHCYAKELHDRRHKAFLAGKDVAPQYAQPFEVLQLLANRLDAPLRRKKPTTYFVNSVSDLFHDDVPDAFLDRVFAVMALTPQHTYQVLTKRADRMREYMTLTPGGWGRGARIADAAQRVCGFDGERYDSTKAAHRGRRLVLPDTGVFWIGARNPPDQPYLERWILRTWPLRNVWLGPSVENQTMADARFPDAAALGEAGWNVMVSMEPLLGAVTIPDRVLALGRRMWIIAGGESGAGARECVVAWLRSLQRQCAAARVAFFLKQLGARVLDRNDAGFEGDTPRSWPMDTDVDDHPHGYREEYQGAPVRVRLRDKKGGDPAEWPADLRVREYPTVPA